MVPVAVLLYVVALPGRSAAGEFTRYTMTAFTNSSEADMSVYESTDATAFHPLRAPAYHPPTGLVRDPSTLHHSDGFYYVAYTTGWDGNTIGFARSTDRVNWQFLRNYTIPLAGVRHTWAPVWFVDSGGLVDVIVSVSFGGDFHPYLMIATDPSLMNYTPPVPLVGIGQNYIDTTIVKTGALYHAFTKNENTKCVEHAVSVTPAGPYVYVGTGNWAGWGCPREGQSLIQLPNGAWRIFLDGYTDGHYYYSDSNNGFTTWSPIQQLPGLSGIVRHFTVLEESVR